MSEIISQDTVKKIEGEGMPLLAELDGKKGDLYITFKIEFPKSLSTLQREELKRVLCNN